MCGIFTSYLSIRTRRELCLSPEMGESPVLSKQNTFDELVTQEKLPQTTSLRARPPNRRPQSRELRLQNVSR